MMTREEAIIEIKNMLALLQEDGENLPEFLEAVDLATRALIPPNEVLTLDELWEMDGKPVWDEKGKCYLVDTTYQFCSDSDIELAIVDKRSIKRYPYRRTLYRRPPEGEEDT